MARQVCEGDGELASDDQLESPVTVQPDLISTTEAGSMPELSKGLFITFEGGEGAGKTTQANRLAYRLSRIGLPVVHAREPGGTQLGERIRSWVKGDSEISRESETLLFVAARAQLVKEVIRPALRKKSIVIIDRYVDSTIAYQGYGRGIKIEQIAAMNDLATRGLLPDLTVLLDADPEEVMKRVETGSPLLAENDVSRAPREGDRVDQRRFEREPASFHKKVRAGYQELARNGSRWSVIRANQAQHRVADAIWKRVRPLLVERGVDAALLTRQQDPKTSEISRQ